MNLNKFNEITSRLLLGIAGTALLAIVFLVVGNIIMRQVASSFGGTTEIVGWLTAVVVSLSLAYSQLAKAHVELDILVTHFPLRLQYFIQALVTIASLLFFAMVAWKLWGYGFNAMQRGSLSSTLRLAFYPVVYLMALGFSAFCLVLLADVLHSLRRGVAREETAK